MTAREAMAYGRPVVATRVGGLADAVEDGETGLLVQLATLLRAAIERLLGDETLRRDLGSCCPSRGRGAVRLRGCRRRTAAGLSHDLVA